MRVVSTTVLAGMVSAVLPGMAAAQFAPPPTAASPTVQERWPDPPKATAPQRSVVPQRSAQPQPSPPAAQPSPQPAPPPTAAPAAVQEEPLQSPEQNPAPKPATRAAAPSYVITCSGVFAKDSTHLKLATKYDSRNITFGQVDGPDGAKIPASILFPNDPKRRLEVTWNNEAGRTDMQVIAINGKSQWQAPKGLKLGLAIAALEKLNRKPFKLSGFGADGWASVLGWEGGALSSLPGGCKVGLRLFADAKAPDDARSEVSGGKELMSNDANLRQLKATVGEILIGY